MHNKLNSKKIYNIGIIVIYFLFVLYLFLSVKDIYLSKDESFTFCLIHKNFRDVMYYTSLDVHPFLYYFFAKLCITPFKSILDQIAALRILSSIPYVVLLIIGNTSIKQKFGKLVSLLFMFAIFTMPLMSQYVYTARMYSFSMLFVTLVFLFFIYIYYGYIRNCLKSAVYISLFSLLAGYSHYIALVDIVIIYLLFCILFIVTHKKIKYIFLSGGIIIICYLPWIFILLHQLYMAKGKFWSTHVTLNNMIFTFYQIFSPIYEGTIIIKVLYSLVFSLILVVLFILYMRYKVYKDTFVNMGLLVFVSDFIVFLIISLCVHHTIFISRYFMISLGIVYLSIAIFFKICLKESLNKKYIKILHILIMLFLLLGTFSYLMNVHINVNGNNLRFEKTYHLINKIPRNSDIIYGGYNRTPISCLSSYHHHNIVLNKPVRLYGQVFDFKTANHIKLNKHKQYFFVKPKHKGNSLSKKFYLKYKSRLMRIGIVKDPNPHNLVEGILYKVKNE